MRPDVAAAFDRMAAAARRDGLTLSITSAFRSDAEQARLFAANPNPKWVAPPGTSLHRYATELDLGPPAAYAWLAANARPFGFIHRYAWEALALRVRRQPARPRAPGAVRARLLGAARRGATGASTTACRRSCRRASRTRSPRRPCAGTCRWSCSRRSSTRSRGSTRSRRAPPARAGSPSSCRAPRDAYGLADPYDPVAAIDAQAHLMSDLLKRFGGKVALALAAYNAGAGAVERYGGVPPYAETRAYVARILGLLGGAGVLTVDAFEVSLVE